jgi:ribosomal protein S18 acetylase RimI-like enzyme
MVTGRVADAQQRDRLWDLMQQEAGDYLTRTLELMGMAPEAFRRLFETVGEVIGIFNGDELAGFYWIEERGAVVHLHALILKDDCRGRGVGTEVLQDLVARYRDTHEAIELGVHASNTRARALYERLGYETVRYLDDLEFYIMQRPLKPS